MAAGRHVHMAFRGGQAGQVDCLGLTGLARQSRQIYEVFALAIAVHHDARMV